MLFHLRVSQKQGHLKLYTSYREVVQGLVFTEGFPKITGILVEVPMTRFRVFGGPYWPPMYRNATI